MLRSACSPEQKAVNKRKGEKLSKVATTMASAVVESSGGRYEAESHMKITSSFLAHLRAGCVCSIPNVQFAAYIVEGCQLLREESRSTTTSRRQRLCFLTFLRALTKLSMLVTSSMDEKHVMCKRLRTWLLVMRKIKLYLLAGLAQLLNDHQNGRHLLHMTQSTFNHILALFPCPLISPNPEESCRKLCKQLVQHYTAQIRHSTHLSSRSSLAIVSFCQLELQISNMKKGLQMDCQTAKMAVIPSNHIKSFNKNLLQSLRVSWKPWVDLVLNCDDVLFKHQTLTLWRSLVDVKSNMTLHQARDFVSSVCTLVETLPCESDALIKRKWLSILCEVLCYGSTLGIQSDVPSEVSEIAHKLLRQSRSESFNVYEVPNVYPGMAGNRAIPTEENDEMDQVPDLVILQGVVLIHLKAVALLVREAQCCSSSDESDSSLSSRGSGSVAEEEREMRMIEKNVIELLSKMRAWINDTLGLPSSSSLISGVTTLFNEQDDGLIEALLCLLDTHSGFQFGSYTARIGVSCLDDDESMDFFNPIDAFEGFLQSISHDPSVILDFLLSNETCFLLYFLRILKYLVKTTSLTRAHPAKTTIYQTLHKVWTSIKKLTNKNLFPYDIAPVVKLLERVNGLYETR